MGCIVIPCPTQSSPANIVSTLTTQLLYMWPLNRSPVSVGYNSHGVIFLAHRTEHTAVSALELARVDEIHGVNLVRGNPRKPDSSQLDCKFVHADSLEKTDGNLIYIHQKLNNVLFPHPGFSAHRCDQSSSKERVRYKQEWLQCSTKKGNGMGLTPTAPPWYVNGRLERRGHTRGYAGTLKV